jgi:hypothetical protein
MIADRVGAGEDGPNDTTGKKVWASSITYYQILDPQLHDLHDSAR